MVTWGELTTVRPDLAEAGRHLLYQYGVGLAFLATVRGDGAPRLHPVCPLIADGGLYAFLVPSPKRTDLHRDARFALHAFATEDNEDAFYIAGEARAEHGDDVPRLEEQFMAERDLGQRPPYFDTHELFELRIERCLHTVTTGHGDPDPQHFVWRAP